MSQSKLTRNAFYIADIICWLFIVTAIVSLIFTFIPPKITLWSFSGLSQNTNIVLEFINTILNGLGFYLIIKRKVIGFVIVVLTASLTLAAQKVFIIESIYILLSVLIVIGLPWFLSYKEVFNAKET